MCEKMTRQRKLLQSSEKELRIVYKNCIGKCFSVKGEGRKSVKF